MPVGQPAAFSPDITCSGSIGSSDPVAVVKLHDATVQTLPEVVLRDYADPANPRTACRFPSTTSRIVQLIDARHVVIASGTALAVVDLPEVRYHWFHLPTVPEGSATFIAVSPGLDQVLWLAAHGDFEHPEVLGTTEIHISTAVGDQVVASMPRPLGGRCGSPEDSKQGAYTNSGNHAFVLDQVIQQYNGLIALEGTSTGLSVLPPAETGWDGDSYPAMATWSPISETLFFRQGSDVWTWTPGSEPEVFLPGIKWYYPTISPDGNHAAFATLRADGMHDVYLLDLTQSDGPRLIGEARNRPTFLNNDQLWYMSEGQGMCGPGLDQPLIYSLADGSEAPSVIDAVIATWPATGSNQ
jgi:hypothetical protein